MLLPQLGKLLGRSSLGSHSPVGKLLWEDFGVTGLSPKLFSKESISCSCCTQLLPQPRSLTRSLSCLCAALMPWTHSSPSCKVMGLKSQSLCLSSLHGKPQIPEQKGQGSSAGVRAVTSWAAPTLPVHGPGTHTASLGSSPSLLLLPMSLKIPDLRETCSANRTPPSPLLLSGFCLRSHRCFPILSGNPGSFNPFTGHEVK